jgi:hypothetical protein
MTGDDQYETVKDRVETLMRARNAAGCVGGLPRPWIVPRITRCDAAYEHIEPFYDGWLRACGCAMIDPPEGAGGRIAPLPLPARARRHEAMSVLRVNGDGSVAGCAGVRVGDGPLVEVWRRVLALRGVDEATTAAARAA